MNYIRYGAGPCAKCQEQGGFHVIEENMTSRVRLLKLMAEMATLNIPGDMPGLSRGGIPLIDGPNGAKFMIGVLTRGPNTIAAISGNADNNARFVRACAHFAYTQAVYVAPPWATVWGGQVTVAEANFAHGGGNTPQPGRCAASKMIIRAITSGWPTPDDEEWNLSEAYYQPSTGRRSHELYAAPNLHTHALSADHCATCINLVPMLMCR
jgi:hypothetical protein